MKKNILCFFRAGLGDFYLSFPLFYTLRNTYKNDKITLVAPFLAADLLHNKGPWFDEIIEPNKFVPERKYDKVYDLDITRTGRSAIFKPEMDYFDIFEATYDVSFGDRKKLPEILKLETIDAEKKAVDDLIEHHRSINQIPKTSYFILLLLPEPQKEKHHLLHGGESCCLIILNIDFFK